MWRSFIHMVFLISSLAWLTGSAQGKPVLFHFEDTAPKTPAPNCLYPECDEENVCALLHASWRQWLGLAQELPLNRSGAPLDPLRRDKKKPYRPSRARKAFWIDSCGKPKNKKNKKTKPLLAA